MSPAVEPLLWMAGFRQGAHQVVRATRDLMNPEFSGERGAQPHSRMYLACQLYVWFRR